MSGQKGTQLLQTTKDALLQHISSRSSTGAVIAQLITLFKEHAGTRGVYDPEVNQWLQLAEKISASSSLDAAMLSGCDAFLAPRSYLAGNALSVADFALYASLRAHRTSLVPFTHVMRWFMHVSSVINDVSAKDVLPAAVPLVFPIAAASDSATNDAKKNTGDSKKSGKADKQQPPSDVKKDKSEKPNKENPKKNKDEKKPAPSPAAPAPAAEEGAVDPSAVDIRVGVIRNCWLHPEADKLLCEEIDLGEAAGPRNIASGLRAHYKPEDIIGRKVLVVANLKDRTMVGFKSQGMVLCASNADHSIVKLVEPPVSANAGDRVTFSGFEGKEPLTSSQVAKKKIYEKFAPGLRTDSKGVVMWTDLPFLVGGEACVAPLTDATVA